MVWRRVLVPESVSLRELHGVVQLAMGWEGIHLFEFAVRGVRYAGPDLSGASTDVALLDLQFRRNARFRYVYDMFCEWEHEIRVEERLAAAPDKAQTARTCIYGHLEEHHVNDPAVSHLEMDDNVPGREHERGRPRHAMSVMSALAL